MEVKRDQLVVIDVDDFLECILCGGYGPIESHIHAGNCVLADCTVDQIFVSVVDRICNRCGCDLHSLTCSACANNI